MSVCSGVRYSTIYTEVKVVLVLLKFASAERTKMAAVCELKQASQLVISS